MRTISTVVGNSPSGHRVFSSTSTFAPASTSRELHGSGSQPPATWPGLEQVERARVVDVLHGHRVRARCRWSRLFSLSHFLNAMSCVLPACGVAMILPLSCSGEVMSGETTSCAPPEVEPAISRIASPLLFAKALMAGPEPMKPASSEPPSSAETSSGPGVEGLGGELRGAQLLLEVAVRHPDQRGGVGDVREVAEAQLGGRGAGGRRRGAAPTARRVPRAGSRPRASERRRAARTTARAEAEQGGAVHVAVPWLFGRASGAAGRRPAGAPRERGAAGAVESATELVEGVTASRRPEPLEIRGRVAGRRAITPTGRWALQRAASDARHHRAAASDGDDNTASVMREPRKCPDVRISLQHRRHGVRRVTQVTRGLGRAGRSRLRGRVPPGEDALVFRTLLESFWPGRRAHAFDQFCR